MFVSRHREKLLNAIIYFTDNTKRCHTLKLFKLLYFLDFEIFRQTGSSVTGLEYVAWPNGPAPLLLWKELGAPKEDLRSAVSINRINDLETGAFLRRDIRAKQKFNSSYFTKRELQLMEQLAFIFMEARATDMTEVSHANRLPWGKVYRKGEGKNLPIPYELSLESEALLQDMPSLTPEEYESRKYAFKEIDEHLI